MKNKFLIINFLIINLILMGFVSGAQKEISVDLKVVDEENFSPENFEETGELGSLKNSFEEELDGFTNQRIADLIFPKRVKEELMSLKMENISAAYIFSFFAIFLFMIYTIFLIIKIKRINKKRRQKKKY